jgi:pimeloyl-ACP methyl ester carboxylesterase
MFEGFATVVCPDLRGYGQSSKPPTSPDHAPYSKRAMARDCVELMRALGHQRFAVAGHDRGAYVACPTLLLWAARDDLEDLYGDPLEIWRDWAHGLRGHSLDSGHHLAEEVPEQLAAELRKFLASRAA